MTLRFLRLGALAFLGATAACTAVVDKPGATGNGSNGSGGTIGGGVGSGGSPVIGSGGVGMGAAGAGPSGSGGVMGSGGSSSIPASLNLSGSPSYFRFIRLTNDQWSNSVRDVLALAATSTLAVDFQAPVSGTTDFTNNELVLDMDDRSRADFLSASESLAAQVTASDAALAKVYAGTDAAGFIAAVGRRAFRRPLTTAEKSTYMTLFTSGANLSGTRSAFAKGASMVIRALLQSPYFLYRSELAVTGAPLSSYEMAAKLSLWLRNTTPSDALLDSAAGPGKLETADGAAAVAKTMLDEPAAVTVMRRFHGEFLHFDRFDQITKVGVANYKTSLNAELAESSYLFFDKIFSQGLGLKDVFLSSSGFVGPGMAALYEGGVAAPTTGYAERNLGATRVGYFSQLPFLMLTAHNADPDSIHRGVTMNLDVLCSQLGPPATVVPPLPAVKPGQTNRQRVDQATSGCGQACHNQMINPLGFAFEHFDGMGQYRDTEKNGNDTLPIDSSGSFVFVDGTKSYSGVPDLMQVLANGQQTHLCYAKKLASFSLQRDVVVADMPLLTAVAGTSLSTSGSVKQIVLELVKQNAFRTRVGGAS